MEAEERPALHTLTAEALRPPYLEDFVTYPMIVRQLQSDVSSRNFARCYSFTGPTGVGKTSLAVAFIRSYQRAEGKRRNDPSLGSPDTFPEGTPFFSIAEMKGEPTDFIRNSVVGALRTQPIGLASMHRFVLIDDVDRLPQPAQNVLNAVLERYAGRSSVIITSNNPELLTPALRSRCGARSYLLKPLAVVDIARALVAVSSRAHLENPDVPRLAHLAAEQANGDLRVAIDLFLSELREAGA